MPSSSAKSTNIRRPALPLAAALRELGFTDYEARAYVALATRQPATAYEIAKVAGLPRANVYSALRNLEARGAIQPVTENPVRYVPVDPELFFSSVQRSTAGLCEDVVQAMKRGPKAEESAYVWIFRGEAEVHAKLMAMIESAREHVWLKAHPRIQVVPHEGDGKPHGTPSNRMLTATADSSDMLIANYAGNARASYARDYSIVYVIETLLLHEIYLAEIHAAMGKQLDAKFGTQLGKLRRKYRPRGRVRPVIESGDAASA